MSLTALAGNQPTPTLAFNFENTATDTMTGLAPSTVNGAPTYVAGKFGQGINFPNPIGFISSNNFVYNTTPTFSNTVGFTFTAWVNFTQPYAASNQYLFSLYGGTPVSTSTSAFYLVVTAAGNVGFRNALSSTGAPLQSNTTSAPVVGQWNHYALSVTATNWNVYINGSFGAAQSGAYGGANLTNITGPLWLGGASGLNSPAIILDDFRLYNRALTDAQILTIYQAGGVPAPYSSIDNRISVGPNLPGGSIRDFSATPLTLSTFAATSVVSNPNSPFVGDASFDITTVNGAPRPPSGLGGSCAYYFLNQSKLNFDFFSTTSNSFLECWLYVPIGSTLGTYPAIASRFPAASRSTDADWQFVVSPVSGTNIPIGMFFLDQLQNRLSPSGLTSINATIGQWNHVTMGWSSVSSRVYIGVNGNIVSGTRNLSSNASQYLATANTTIGNQVWDYGSLVSNFRIVSLGSNTLPYTTTYTVPTSPVGTYPTGTTALLIRSPAPSISVIADYSPSPINLATYATDMPYVPTVCNGPFASSPIEGSFIPCIYTTTTVFPSTITKLNFDFFLVSSNSFMEFWWFAPSKVTTTSRFWFRTTGVSGNSNGDFNIVANPSPGGASLIVATGASTQTTITTSNYNLNAWNHVSVSWNFTNTTAYISMNGNVSQASLSGRTIQYQATGIQFCTQFNPGSLISNFRVVSGPATLPYIVTGFAPPTSPLGLYPTGTTVLLMRSVNPTMQLTGTPILSQLSVAPVAAFSLRAVGGTTARAVQVVRNSDSATQDFYADRLGNLLTAPVTGTNLATWLGGSTGNVATWYDQSGQGNHMSCSSFGIQPKIDLVNNFIDLKPSAYFDVSAGTTGPVPFQSSKNYTVVFRHGQFNGSGLFATSQNAAGPYGNLVNNFKKGSGLTYTQYWYGNDVQNKGTLATGNRVSYKWDGTNRSLYVNGVLVDVSPSSGWAQTSSAIQMIGKTNFDGAMNGELYGAFMFTTALSDTDRTLLENFL